MSLKEKDKVKKLHKVFRKIIKNLQDQEDHLYIKEMLVHHHQFNLFLNHKKNIYLENKNRNQQSMIIKDRGVDLNIVIHNNILDHVEIIKVEDKDLLKCNKINHQKNLNHKCLLIILKDLDRIY